MATSPITSQQIEGGKVKVVTDFLFLGSKITEDGDCSHEEIPRAQGKRNLSKMVGVPRGHQRVDTLKLYSQKTSQSNHTLTTASMKLSHALWGHPRWTGHGGEV